MLAATGDRLDSIPNLTVTLCEVESNERRQEDIDLDNRSNISNGSRLLFDTSGETERDRSLLGSALSCGIHLDAVSPLTLGGFTEEIAESSRKRKGKERAPDSDQAEQEQSGRLSEGADDNAGDHDHDLSYDSDFSESDIGAGKALVLLASIDRSM